MAGILPEPGFLEGLREVCNEYGSVLIFDEVMTGFRVAYGGAQSLYGIFPDMTCLGKIIGGGLPVGAYGGKREIMEELACRLYLEYDVQAITLGGLEPPGVIGILLSLYALNAVFDLPLIVVDASSSAEMPRS